MDPVDLTDLSLLVLADVAVSERGTRRFDRMVTLLERTPGRGSKPDFVPAAVKALESAGLVEVRRSTRDKASDATPGWTVSLTDAGQTAARLLTERLRDLAAA